MPAKVRPSWDTHPCRPQRSWKMYGDVWAIWSLLIQHWACGYNHTMAEVGIPRSQTHFAVLISERTEHIRFCLLHDIIWCIFVLLLWLGADSSVWTWFAYQITKMITQLGNGPYHSEHVLQNQQKKKLFCKCLTVMMISNHLDVPTGPTIQFTRKTK